MLNNLIGKRFGRLIVIERAENDKNNKARWLCRCDCGNEKIISRHDLTKSGRTTKSCGCLWKEYTSNYGKSLKKYNKYDLNRIFGIGYTSNTNKEFYFDLEDYCLIKDYCWMEDKLGYVVSREFNNGKSKEIKFHRIVMNCDDSKIFIDHINHNKLDNKKVNLRKCTQQKNSQNRLLPKNNTSGIMGVTYRKDTNKWRSMITCDGKRLYLGNYNDFEDAIKARLQAEIKYFGKEFAPQRHLFKEYGIGDEK